MTHIPTDYKTVSRLKKDAKRAVREGTSASHAEALERVAKEAGYTSWKHVVTCHEAGGSRDMVGAITALDVAGSGGGLTQTLTLITGEIGSGKSIIAMDEALNALRRGTPVTIVDFLGSSKRLCALLKGKYEELSEDGTKHEQVYGSNCLRVVDVREFRKGSDTDNGAVQALGVLPEGALLVIDHLEVVQRSFPEPNGLRNLVASHLERGGSATVVALRPENARWLDEVGLSKKHRSLRRTVLTVSTRRN